MALIDAGRLDSYHRLEHERIHPLLLDDIDEGIADIEAGPTRDARRALAGLQRAATRLSAGARSRCFVAA